MKTAYYFDFDHTIFHNKRGEIPSETIRLLEYLAASPNVILGLATGRSISKLDKLEPYLQLFHHLVLINGSTGYIKGKPLYKEAISPSHIEHIIKITEHTGYAIGMVSEYDDVIIKEDLRIRKAVDTLHAIQPIVDPTFHLHHDVYQLWVFGNDDYEILDLAKQLPHFQCFLWHEGGADFIYPHVDKAFGIKKMREHDPFEKLVVIGDGQNDMSMIDYADIGIAMGNAKDPKVKEKAQLIAPHIEENQLFTFFKDNNLLPR